jgi:metalloprotein, YbeY/UPF0054 family
VDIIFCSKAYIRKLNKAYRGKNYPTDILSFEIKEFMDNNIFYLGEIYISPEVASGNAKVYKEFWEKELWIGGSENTFKHTGASDFYRELALLLIHGILHLFSYTHDEEHKIGEGGEEYNREMKNMQKIIYKKIASGSKKYGRK